MPYLNCTLTLTPDGKYRIQTVGSETDWTDFDTAQDAFDCWDWCHTGEPLTVNIDHRQHTDYFGRPVARLVLDAADE